MCDYRQASEDRRIGIVLRAGLFGVWLWDEAEGFAGSAVEFGSDGREVLSAVHG